MFTIGVEPTRLLKPASFSKSFFEKDDLIKRVMDRRKL
jgi:hypothetical protein